MNTGLQAMGAGLAWYYGTGTIEPQAMETALARYYGAVRLRRGIQMVDGAVASLADASTLCRDLNGRQTDSENNILQVVFLREEGWLYLHLTLGSEHADGTWEIAPGGEIRLERQ